MTSIKVTNIPVQPLFLGFPGENDSRPVYVDVSPWLEEFPDATVSIVYTRSDGLTYAVVVNQIGPVVTWKPIEADLVEGKCKLQIQIKQGDAVKKDSVVDCYVGKSLDDPSDPPQDPRPTYVEEVIDAADRAEAAVTHYPQIRNDYWWVWDAESGKWVNTGVKATGEGGGNPNAVLYTQQSLTDSQKAQARTNVGAGTYSKPSGGIPASDLASAVQTSLGKADTALQTAPVASVNGQTGAVTVKEPYYLTVTTSGNTTYVDKTPAEIDALSAAGYDVHLYHVLDGGIQIRIDYRFGGYIPFAGLAALTAEYAGVSYAAVVHADKTVEFTLADFDGRIDIIEGDISTLQTDKADKTEIPTKVSDLINDSGYQTAQQVQTAIANIPDELPTVTASDNGKFLRVVSGAWAAATVPSAESNSFGGGA